MKRKGLLVFGLSIILLFILILYPSGRKAKEYYGRWSDGYDVIFIKKAGENNSVIIYDDYDGRNSEKNIFCTFKDGCFYEVNSGDGVACETGDFQLVFKGVEYGLEKKMD